ncbi:hypothetical protein [Aliivibrio sp. 1S128]|uniref:hypothetical protein n=1 Tax=Aliivibrio sp. 1S128 TaxID=1840085 RepID=UPI00080E4AC8|nr:hypothetical protein [Aliivibrio sp. 1S128]OCH25833.1 hypothetical protein A6E03_00020 [Aliivibrio sp. 1S128]
MITSYDTEFTINYGEEYLNNIFVYQDDESGLCENFDDDGFHICTEFSWTTYLNSLEINKSLLLSTSSITSDDAIRSLQELADNNIQIFLLLDDSDANREAIEALSGRCCIRIGVAQQGALIIADHQQEEFKQGVIFSNDIVDNSDFFYHIELEEKQIDDYYRLFCYLFWTKSTSEYLIQGKKQSCSNGDSPVNYIDLPHQHVLSESLFSKLNTAITHQSSVCSNEFLLEQLSQSKTTTNVLMTLGQSSKQPLLNLINATDHIQLFEKKALPQVILSKNEAWLLPTTSDVNSVNWALKLTENQRCSIENYQNELLSTCYWNLNKRVKLKSISSTVLFANQMELEVNYEDEMYISLNNTECKSFDDFENKSAHMIAEELNFTKFNDRNLAKKIHYSITISPPYLASNAKEDPLHQHWLALQQHWNDEVERLERKQFQIEKSKDTVSDNVKRFMSNFLTGQLNKKRTQTRELDKLKTVTLSKLSLQARSKAEKDINELILSLSLSMDKVVEATDIAEQELKWDRENSRLTQILDSSTKNSAQAERELEQFKLKSVDETKENNIELSNNWQHWLVEFCKTDFVNKVAEYPLKRINEFGAENTNNLKAYLHVQFNDMPNEQLIMGWNALIDTYKQNPILEKELPQTADDIRVWLNSHAKSTTKKLKQTIKNLIDADVKNNKQVLTEERKRVEFATVAFKQMFSAYEQKVNGLNREHKSLMNNVEQLNNKKNKDLSDLDKHSTNKIFKTKNKDSVLAKLFGKNVMNTNTSFVLNWPSEELPCVGNLYTCKNNRFLAIRYKADIELARQEAARLHADLVVERSSK